MYIEMFHGRKDPDQRMDDWGELGPIFGPFSYVHITYASDIKFPDDNYLNIHDGLVFYDGMYYGDFNLIDNNEFENGKCGNCLRDRHEKFEQEKALLK